MRSSARGGGRLALKSSVRRLDDRNRARRQLYGPNDLRAAGRASTDDGLALVAASALECDALRPDSLGPTALADVPVLCALRTAATGRARRRRRLPAAAAAAAVAAATALLALALELAPETRVGGLGRGELRPELRDEVVRGAPSGRLAVG